MKMNWFIQNKTLFIIFRVVVGFIFIYAGAEKILNPKAFAEAINNYRILPHMLVNLFAIILPWIEFFTGVSLIFGWFIKGSSLILLGLLSMFTVAITLCLIRGIDISCGCKTPWEASDKIGIKKLIEEFILFFMMVQVYLHRSEIFCFDKILNKK
jgi:putative oxidoreductase